MSVGKFLGKMFSSATGGLVESIGKTVDRFIVTGDDKDKQELAKANLNIEIEKIVQERMSELEQTTRAELKAKENIIVAEMQQGDNYTKRARPTVVYFGLLVIAFNHCVVPSWQLYREAETITTINLPTEFWVAWGGIVATWSIGRSAVQMGIKSKATSLITGSKKSLFD